MRKAKYILVYVIFLIYPLALLAQMNHNTYKPWTYWWWMGSAVNREGIKKQLLEFSDAGIGGVHIIPIYGVREYEEQFLPFLSEEWFEMIHYTIDQALALSMGVDITLGTGWPYGGSWIDKNHAACRLIPVTYHLNETSHIAFHVDSIIRKNDLLDLLAVFAANEQGEQVNLSMHIASKRTDQDVPLANWELTCFGIINTNQKVKRAAPGGEGLVMDYFNETAVKNYLHHFDSILLKTRYTITPRAYYHDSYEVFGANWTMQFMDKFKALNGYDLLNLLPVILDTVHPDRPHIIHDIREALSELLYSGFAFPWEEWCGKHGTNTRYQAPG